MYSVEKEWFAHIYDAILMCEKFGWDYYTYINQPSFFRQSIVNWTLAEKAFAETNLKKQETK